MTLVLVLSAALEVAEAQEQWRWDGIERVVVVADVHGAYAAFVELLQASGVIDAETNWSGQDTHLVSLGDLLDRGPESRRAMDLVMRLQTQAIAAGGYAHFVAGNHELMNMTGDLRYVSPAEFAAFVPEETASMRAAALADITAAADASVAPEQLDSRYPPGYFAHRAAFAPQGRYGSWLLTQPAVVVVNGVAFVHGGLPGSVAESSLAELNRGYLSKLSRYLELREQLAGAKLLPAHDMQRDLDIASAAVATAPADAAELLEEFVALGNSPELGLDSPLWYRGSVYCKPMLEEPILEAALAELGAERVMVGHTPTDNHRVQSHHDGRLVVLDTGMLASYYEGRPAAVLLDKGRMHVQYTDPAESASLELADHEAYGLDGRALREALEQGEITVLERGEAAWLVAVEHSGVRFQARFFGADAGTHELAADAIDDLLGTALVAPTVARSIEGQTGALQLRYPDALSESQRLAQELGIGTWCPIEPQVQLMFAFDALTGNRGRHPDNILFADDLSNLVLTDHGRAFGTERTLGAGVDPSTFNMPARLVEALRALDEPNLDATVGEWLSRRQIRGLLGRRDRLLAAR